MTNNNLREQTDQKTGLFAILKATVEHSVNAENFTTAQWRLFLW